MTLEIRRIGGVQQVRQVMPSVAGVKSTSPLVHPEQKVATIAALAKAGIRVITVDSALGRYEKDLCGAGINAPTVRSLLDLNFDHHDGANPGRTATEVTLKALETRPSEFQGNYAVVVDHIDLDSVCSAFVAMASQLQFNLIEPDKKLLTEVSRYGDFIVRVDDDAMKIALSLEAMRFGKNKFSSPFFRLSPEQQQELFNEMIEAMPRMLTGIEQFKNLYEGELAKLRSEEERAKREGLIKPANRFVSFVTDPNLPQSVVYQVKDHVVTMRIRCLDRERYIYNPVGLNSRMAGYDLSDLWSIFRKEENRVRKNFDLTALDDKDNWGGREVAGGSNRDEKVGSLLHPDQVAEIIENYLFRQITLNFEQLVKGARMPARDLAAYVAFQTESHDHRTSWEEIIKMLRPDEAEKIISETYELAHQRARHGRAFAEHWEVLNRMEWEIEQAALGIYTSHLMNMGQPGRIPVPYEHLPWAV